MADQVSGVLSPFLRQRRIRAALPHIGAGRVLDVGCGAGALAAHIEPARYLGVDVDDEAIKRAQRDYPRHTFLRLDAFERSDGRGFDTIVALAVLEHVPSPDGWLWAWSRRMAVDGRIVLTTPHPRFRAVHEWGAALGVFSADAAAEHEALLDRAAVKRACIGAGLTIARYRPFLCLANQLFVIERAAVVSTARAARAALPTPRGFGERATAVTTGGGAEAVETAQAVPTR